jgi:guanosine-3',5'-bis(diphosphate) 3'-pyrophosphohydrolase
MLEPILTSYTDTERGHIQRAVSFAKEAHKGQKRKSGEDFLTHPLHVAHTLTRLNLDYETVVAGILHDVLEENPGITREQIAHEFNENIARLIEGVTNLKEVDFVGEQAFAENFRKMVLATARDIRVVLIKLADVLHNVHTLGALPEERRKRYAREVLEIYAPLAERLGIGELKGELEDAAFPHVYPEEYKALTAQADKLLKENKKYIEKLKPTVLALLKKEGVEPLSLHARVKHLYSLWKKLNRYEGDWSKVYDLVALRIIVHSVQDCYSALGALHKAWTPLPGRIKDYIALPKPNGYRSLHTTIFTDPGKITEVQIRTEEMHYEAELGVAAHWAYKEGVRVRSGNPAKGQGPIRKHLRWIEQLGEWQKTQPDSAEFLESLKIDFFKNRIFVFTPKGDVIDLPDGATPVDFAYAVHSDLGEHCMLARVNGKAVALDTALSHNDIVEIVTNKKQKPSRDWLTFVKTSKARGKIRDALRKQKK